MFAEDRVGRRCRRIARAASRVFLAASLLIVLRAGVATANPDTTVPPGPAGASLFDHHGGDHSWISGQANLITQAHPSFSALYTGDQSFQRKAEIATSFVGTLFTGFSLTSTTDLIADIEMAAGGGVSQAYGLGGFTNLDVVRNPTLGREPYLARAMLHQVIPIGGVWSDVARGPLQMAARRPEQRLEIWAGKLSTVDFFDRNAAGSDSHTQFMNWTVDNNGAYDYAADTRGYSYGIVIAYESARGAVRLGEVLMPKLANGVVLQWDPRHSRGETLELELRFQVHSKNGTVRGLGYLNHANMGHYRDAIDSFVLDPAADQTCRAQFEQDQARLLPGPVIECHRAVGRLKAGVGISVEQEVFGPLRAFGRAGWNDGRNESFAYTEVDSTVELGFDTPGAWWRRDTDRVGVAFVSNGISDVHRRFLALGGKGFLLGDGMLSYGRETIAEGYYNAFVRRGLSVALDAQYIRNPGYNQDRGPVTVGSLRVHQEF